MPTTHPPRPAQGGAGRLVVSTDGTLPPRRGVLRVAGELDLATAPLLARELDLAGAGRTDLVLDLSALAFCDVVGLTSVEQAARRLRDRGCRLSVQGGQDALHLLMRVPGLFLAVPAAGPDGVAAFSATDPPARDAQDAVDGIAG